MGIALGSLLDSSTDCKPVFLDYLDIIGLDLVAGV